jgi:hypothetical protein
VQKRSMNSKGHGMVVALVILATRGPLRRSEGRARNPKDPLRPGSIVARLARPIRLPPPSVPAGVPGGRATLPGKSGKQIERCVISTLQIAEDWIARAILAKGEELFGLAERARLPPDRSSHL